MGSQGFGLTNFDFASTMEFFLSADSQINAEKPVREKINVTNEKNLNLMVAPGGGYVAHFRRIDP